MKFATKLIHHPHSIDPFSGGVSPSVQRSSTFAQQYGKEQEFSYSRGKNPTRQVLEDTIAALENGHSGYAFASGMAAIAAALGIFAHGDHLVVADNLYGGTEEILKSLASRYQLEYTRADAQDLNALEQALRPNTRGIFIESPANPTLAITDLSEVQSLAHRHGAIVIIDNTFMSPYLQRPIDLGIDVVVHSATKFLGGHSDLLAGLVVVKSANLAEHIHAQQRIHGGILGPDDSWLLLRGMKTLAVRMDRSQENATKVAHYLAQHPAVSQVYYPGLPQHPGYAIHQKQSDGAGAVLSFELTAELPVEQFLARLHTLFYGASLGGVESIISHPFTMSHAFLSPEERARLHITPQLLRLSVGIESIDDLIQEMREALSY